MNDRRWEAVAGLALLFVAATMLQLPPALGVPPPNGQPIPPSSYGSVTVYGGPESNLGSPVTIKIYANGFGAFFVTKLLVFLNVAADSDLLLSSISIDGINTISLSPYTGAPRVVVVSAGNTIGEVTSALPSYLSFLLVKDPLGNSAIVVSGGSGNGLTVVLQFSSQSEGVSISTEAFVMAPTNNTITLSMS